MTIPSPPLESQRAIAEVLSALDDKIAANEHMIAAGKGLLRSRWEQLTSNSTDTVELQDIAEINPKVPTVKEETASYLDMKNLPEHGLLVSEWGSREPKGGARFQNGDTLIARITPCFENGKAAWVDFLEADEVCYGSTEYIVMRPCRGVPDIVPYLVGTSDHFREFASQRRTGTSGRQRVQAKELSDYSVRIPEAVQLNEFRSFAEPLLPHPRRHPRRTPPPPHEWEDHRRRRRETHLRVTTAQRRKATPP
jgi:type I restriction enzyme S subunit